MKSKPRFGTEAFLPSHSTQNFQDSIVDLIGSQTKDSFESGSNITINVTVHEHNYPKTALFVAKDYELGTYLKERIQIVPIEDEIDDSCLLDAACEQLAALNKDISELRGRLQESLARINTLEENRG